MTMTDPIADMLTRLRNANSAYHDAVSMPFSKLKSHIAEILQAEGYIASWKIEDAEVGKTLTIELKYGPTASGPSLACAVSPSPVCASTPSRPTFPRCSAASVWPSFPPRLVSSRTARPRPRVWAGKSSPTSGKGIRHVSYRTTPGCHPQRCRHHHR